MSESAGEIPAPRPEFEIGGGDPIRIMGFEEMPTDALTGVRMLPVEALNQAREQLQSLPFSIGNKNTLGYRKPRHDAVVSLQPRIDTSDTPEDEKGKYTLNFRFGEKAGQHGVSLSTHKDLRIRQHRSPDGLITNTVGFSPDQPLNIAGKEVREVTLIMPIEQPKPQQ